MDEVSRQIILEYAICVLGGIVGFIVFMAALCTLTSSNDPEYRCRNGFLEWRVTSESYAWYPVQPRTPCDF